MSLEDRRLWANVMHELDERTATAIGYALAEGVTDYAIILLDPEGRITAWSAGARALKGYEAREVIGQSFELLYTSEDRTAGKPGALLARAAKYGRIEDEGWRQKKDGTRFWADVIITAIRDDAGQLSGFVKVTRDLSERRNAEEQLRQSEQRTQLLIESVKDYAIFMVDPDGIVASWNKGAEQIKGYTREEIIGSSVERFYTEADVRAGKPRALLEAATEEGRVEDEGWRIRKDGTRFWADVVITALRGEDGALLGFAKVTRDLTERRNAERALRESEESLAATLYSIGDAVIATDVSERITRMNPTAARLTGWTQREASGRPIREVFRIINEETRATVDSPVARVLAEGRIVGLANHTVLIARDGAEYPIADTGAPIIDALGAVTGAVLVFRDVTLERLAEKSLRESDERLRLMIESLRDYAINMLDPSGRITSWNNGAERIHGYRAAEVLGEHFSLFYPGESIAAKKPERDLELAAHEGRFQEEGWRMRKDGAPFWANLVLSAVRDAGGALLGYAQVTRDMSERRRTDELLAMHARQQAAIAELGLFALEHRDALALQQRAVDCAAKVLSMDFAEILELDPAREGLVMRAGSGWPNDLIGRPYAPEADDPALFAERGILSGIRIPIGAAGSRGLLGVHGTTPGELSSDDLAFLQGVTNLLATALERSEAETQLASAEAAVRDRDLFISVASHELRTPLTALTLKLQGMDTLLKRSTERGGQLDMRLGAALKQTDRLGDLIERLLDVSRIVSGRLDLQYEELELGTLVRDVADDLREAAEKAGSPITVRIKGSTRGKWDRSRIERVIANVVGNAIKYGERRPIEIEVGDAGARVEMRVIDRGIGIQPENIERIFSRFERAASVQHYGGLGLGLYIARFIVEAHGGSITASSTPGVGSTFTIILPKVLSAHAEIRVGEGIA